MKKLFTLLLLFSSLGLLKAQPPGGRPPGGGYDNGRPSRPTTYDPEATALNGNAKLTGFVIDSNVTTAIEFATVALKNQKTGKVMDGTMADENGKFTFNKVPEGVYSVTATFIGYEDKIVNNIQVNKKDDIDLGVLKMQISSTVLDEVTVTGLKSLIEEKVDRLIYNAENDLTSKGGDGADILRKVPMLSVDLEGNVSLRGSSNIRVLINNKPSTMVASSVADALKMIPADLIKSVEVITSPSAKYDAEGTSGIINIITKKSSIQGYSLNLNSGVGVRGSNLGLNGNLRVGKFGFTLGGFGRTFYNKAKTELDQTTFASPFDIVTKQSSSAKDNGLFGRYNVGIDYEINKSSYLNGTVSLGTRNFKRSQDYTISIMDSLTRSTNRFVNSEDLSNNMDVSLDYVKIFAPSHELSFSTLYSQNNLINNFTADLYNADGNIFNQQINNNKNTNKETTFQTDYMVPIGTKQQFEVGLKQIFREVDSRYGYTTGLGVNVENDLSNPSGLLNYNQNISAGYISYTLSTAKKLAFKIGTRYEYTTIDANDQGSILNIPSYGNLVPSINISKPLASGGTIKLAYNNRIQRPGLQQLNPNFNRANPQNITVGNPNLRPEISNNLELSLSKTFKRNYVNASVFGRQTNNSILRISSPSDTLAGAIVTTYQNLGKQQTTGLNLFGNFFLTQKWSINGGMDMYYTYLEGQVQTKSGYQLINNDGIVVSGRLMSQLSLDKGWGLQAFGGYRGRDVTLLGSRSGMGFYSLGVRKDFNEKKGTIGLSAENFVGGMVMRTVNNSPLFTQKDANYIYNQNIKLTFSYKLGNMRMVEKKKTKSVNNNDVKGGGSSDSSEGFN